MTQHINLYHAGLEPPRQRYTAHQGLALVGLCLLALGVGAWSLGQAAQSQRGQARQLQAELDGARETLTRVSGAGALPPDEMRELTRLRLRSAGERRLKTAIDTGEAGAGGGFSEELMAFGRRAHTQVWLTGLSLTRADNAIELRGRTTDAAMLPDYLQSLQAEPALRGRPFAQMQLRGDALDANGAALPYAEFTLRSSVALDPLRPPGAPK